VCRCRCECCVARRSRVVYGLADPRSGVIRYVGKARDAEERLKRHFEKPSKRVKVWLDDLASEDRVPAIVVLATVPEEDALLREAQWIEGLNRTGPKLLNVAGTVRRTGPTVVVTARFPQETWDRVDAMASRLGCTRSDVMRDALDRFRARVEAGDDPFADRVEVSRATC
jgi:hypothetical protein